MTDVPPTRLMLIHEAVVALDVPLLDESAQALANLVGMDATWPAALSKLALAPRVSHKTGILSLDFAGASLAPRPDGRARTVQENGAATQEVVLWWDRAQALWTSEAACLALMQASADGAGVALMSKMVLTRPSLARLCVHLTPQEHRAGIVEEAERRQAAQTQEALAAELPTATAPAAPGSRSRL